MLNKLTLHNFKSYKDQEFEFSNLTVFCGNNSVGKSTAIQAISIPLQSYFDSSVALNGELVELGTIDDVHNQRAEDVTLKLEFEIDNHNISWGFHDIDEQENISSRHLSAINFPTQEARESLRSLLDSVQYLQAERFGPKSNYDIAKSSGFHKDWLGAKGEFTSEFLSHLNSSRRLFVGGVTDAGSGVDDPRLHSNEKQNRLGPQIDAWLKEISPGISVTSTFFEEASTSANTFAQNGNNSLKPHNVGFGVSYVLSIVTALLYTKSGGLVIIENPEAHLHPRGQSFLGRLIALTAQAGVQVVVETHSDHLLNGIRVITRIKEDFDPKLFTLYYISQGEGQSNVDKITITKDGKLSNWPDGFFDQQAQDMFMIMTGQDQPPSKGA
ncbi:DUF3696 domain-containing protein [Vibrio penaeicida]|uniref:DUF3696 domain-containing protein n=1 Tax=Vibrio penaeicida TaxID=104609 RepID=UPI00273777D8|nr:DUF3696 domain-containing protein [Vibrio penaeicida]MDP2572263.1 DUF3696 domain-containing protein [Vibrio penaeicida]